MANVTVDDIARMVCDLFDEGTFETLDDDTKAARLISRHFEVTRESELTKYAWAFATFYVDAEAIDVGPVGPEKWFYAKPDDCLRLLPMTTLCWPQGTPIPTVEAAEGVYTVEGGTRTIAYIANVNDPADWTALFTEVLVAAIGMKIAYPLTQKSGMVQLAQSAYDRAIADAYRIGAFTKLSQRPVEQTWADTRAGSVWRL